MFRQTAFALATAGIVAGCAADGSVREKTVGGAVLGSIAGGVAGALIGDRKGALIGAGIGAVVGAGVGTFLDEQQRQLESDLDGTGATITNTGEELLVNLPSSVTFAVDSADIQPQFRTSLSEVARTLTQYESSLVDVIGHTDSTGAEDYNQELSQRRANSVANFLISRGVIRERVAAFGRGESEPIASNDTASGRAQNRRVELRIIPLTEDN